MNYIPTNNTQASDEPNDDPSFRQSVGRLRKYGLNRPWVVICAFVIIGAFISVAVLGALFQQYDYATFDLLNILKPPGTSSGGSYYLLGTDELGRDVLSRWIFSVRMSLMIAVIGASIGAVIGSVLGMVAAHFRGWVEEVIMMLVDVQSSMPFIIFALAVIALTGGDFLVLVIVIGIDGWERYARIARGVTLSVGQAPFVFAARSSGLSEKTIYGRYITPNILPALIIQFTINLPSTILLETSISFLGLGVQPPLTSLGQMLGDGREYLLFAPWVAVTAGTTIFLITLSVSIIGDWLRDKFDPTVD